MFILMGADVSGYGTVDVLEIFHFKSVLHLKANAPKVMIYGETGRFQQKARMVSFWAKLITQKSSKVSLALYRVYWNLDINRMYCCQ